jgi:L,D-transpeptidase ErfK/SrfK
LCQIIDLSRLSNRLHLLILFIFIIYFHGCAVTKKIEVKPSPSPIYREEKIERNDFSLAKGDDVIGRLAALRLERGDTLPDIARHFSLGVNAISAANPGVDVWVPEAGQRILLPLGFILPAAPRKGIVITLAAMRLFQFKGDSESLAVSTIGKECSEDYGGLVSSFPGKGKSLSFL